MLKNTSGKRKIHFKLNPEGQTAQMFKIWEEEHGLDKMEGCPSVKMEIIYKQNVFTGRFYEAIPNPCSNLIYTAASVTNKTQSLDLDESWCAQGWND